MSIVYLVVGLCWLAFFFAWIVLAAAFGGRGRGRESSIFVIVRVLVSVAVIALGVRFASRVPFGSVEQLGDRGMAIGIAGAALNIIGVSFAIWARVALGRNWGMPMTLHADPELVTRGPYRCVRHPIYTGMILMLAGTTLVFPLAAFASLAMLVYMVISAVREERDMTQRFPDAYPEYRKRSKMLLPFVF